MSRYEREIVPAEELIGFCDIGYDDKIADYEAVEDHSLPGGRVSFIFSPYLSTKKSLRSPRVFEKEVEKFLSDKLWSILE